MKDILEYTNSERDAILTLHAAHSLTRNQGAWRNGSAHHRVNGVIIANLRRDGIVNVTTYANTATATLTSEGAKLALVIACDARRDPALIAEQRKE